MENDNTRNKIESDLFNALYAMHFVVRGEAHFGACGIRNTDFCTTPTKCSNARKALKASESPVYASVYEATRTEPL